MSEVISTVYTDVIHKDEEQVEGTIYQLSAKKTYRKTMVARIDCNQNPPPNCPFANQSDVFKRVGIAECLIESSSVYPSETVLCGKMEKIAKRVEQAENPQNRRPK